MPIFLWVVAGTAAGGEGVADQKSLPHRDLVGDVGECRPLSAATTRYGSSPSCRITSRGGMILPAGVVGHVQQCRDEAPVTGHGLVPVARFLLQHEAALRADRHDHGLLHICA